LAIDETDDIANKIKSPNQFQVVKPVADQ